MVAERPKYFSDMEDPPEFLKSLEQARRLSTSGRTTFALRPPPPKATNKMRTRPALPRQTIS